jgi:TP901 family phage tail tape measure protein
VPGNEKVGGVQIDAEINLSKINDAGKSLEASLGKIDPALKRTEKGFREIENASGVAARSTNALHTSFGKLVGAMGIANIAASTLQRGLQAAASGLKYLFTAPLNQAAAFDEMMRKISTVVEDDSAPAIAKLGKAILDMSRKFPKSADELGAGLYKILQAGVTDSADAMKLLEASTKAAIAGVTEVGTASELLTNIMSAYNLTADETVGLLDSIFVGAQRGKAEFSDLAGSMGQTLGSASLLNVTIPEIVSGIETMVNAGFSADESAVSINAFLTSVISASDQSTEAAKTARSLGIEYNSAALKAKGFQAFVQELTSKVGNNETAIQSLTGNVRAFRAVASIAGKGNEFFTKTLEEMEIQVGAMDKAFMKNVDTLSNAWQLALNEFNATLIEAGSDSVPGMKDAVNDLTKELGDNREEIQNAANAMSVSLVGAMQEVVDNAPEIIKALGMIATAAANVVVALSKIPTFVQKSGENVRKVGLELNGFAQQLFTGGVSQNVKNEINTIDKAHGRGMTVDQYLQSIGLTATDASVQSATDESERIAAIARLRLKGEDIPKDATFDEINLYAQGKGNVAKGIRKKRQEEENPNRPVGGSGGSDKAAKEAEKALVEVQKALDKQAQADRERIELRKKELELKQRVSVLTKDEEKELAKINRRLEFQMELKEKAIDDATTAWEKQKGVVEDLRQEIEDINEEIRELPETLKKTFAEMDRKKADNKADAVTDLLTEQQDLQGRLDRREGLSSDQMSRLDQIQGLLAGKAGTDEFKKGKETFDVQQTGDPFQMIDLQDQRERQKVEEEAMFELKQKLTDKTRELETAEKDLKIASDDIVKALEQRRIFTDTNFTAIEGRTKSHVDTMIAEYRRLAAEARAAEGGVSVTPGFANGGAVFGKGTSTSDSIVARLSNDEHVLDAEDVRLMGGHGMVYAFRDMLKSVPRFAQGGAVTTHQNNAKSVTINNYGEAARLRGRPDIMAWDIKMKMR